MCQVVGVSNGEGSKGQNRSGKACWKTGRLHTTKALMTWWSWQCEWKIVWKPQPQARVPPKMLGCLKVGRVVAKMVD
jgi:hypothetical protein